MGDRAKKLVVTLALMVPIVNGMVWIIQASGDRFFIYLWLFTTLITFVRRLPPLSFAMWV